MLLHSLVLTSTFSFDYHQLLSNATSCRLTTTSGNMTQRKLLYKYILLLNSNICISFCFLYAVVNVRFPSVSALGIPKNLSPFQ